MHMQISIAIEFVEFAWTTFEVEAHDQPTATYTHMATLSRAMAIHDQPLQALEIDIQTERERMRTQARPALAKYLLPFASLLLPLCTCVFNCNTCQCNDHEHY